MSCSYAFRRKTFGGHKNRTGRRRRDIATVLDISRQVLSNETKFSQIDTIRRKMMNFDSFVEPPSPISKPAKQMKAEPKWEAY